MKIQPNNNRILVQQIKTQQSETATGIILPSTLDREEKTQGKVIAVGKDYKDKFEMGQIVFYGKYAGEQIKIQEKKNEVEYVLLTDDEVLGWID